MWFVVEGTALSQIKVFVFPAGKFVGPELHLLESGYLNGGFVPDIGHMTSLA
jgi:hypothetical protein